MILELGRQYVTRGGIVTGPLERAKNGTKYKFGAWVQESRYPDPTWMCWADNGEFFYPMANSEKDLVAPYNLSPEHPECCGWPMTIDGRVLRCETCKHAQEINETN